MTVPNLRREWIDWTKPCLPSAARWLVEQAAEASDGQLHSNAALCDLGRVVCVLPGARAGRILLSLLAGECRERNLVLAPPAVLTLDPMIDRILELEGPIAGEAEMEFAWMAALQACEPGAIEPLLPRRPAADDLPRWSRLAGTVARLHQEIAGGRLTFGRVAEAADGFEMIGEGDRWRALEAVHAEYRRVLKAAALVDRHAAREDALRRIEGRRSSAAGGASQGLDRLVLIGVAELNVLQRAASATVASAVALVHASEEAAARFDEWGCVVPEAWAEARIDINDEQIAIADRADDQAQSALRAIDEFGGGGRLSAAQITIGLGDEALAPALEHAARWAGLAVRAAAGRDPRHTPPVRALLAIADWLDDPRFAGLAAMLRHADIESFIWNHAPAEAAEGAGVSDWLTLLDRYFADHLHERVSGQWLGEPEGAKRLARAYDAVVSLVRPLSPENDGMRPRPAGEWVAPIIEVLSNLYGDLEASPVEPGKRLRTEACMLLRDAAAEVAGAPLKLQPAVSAAAAIRLIAARLSGTSLAEEPDPSQIEMLGWLELHLDPAPALIVSGFNEGRIPQSVTADAFLPDALRRALGLQCNQRRYARDAYLLEAILRSRPHVRLVAGRQAAPGNGAAAVGEPLAPSRLMMACDEPTLARRIRLTCDESLRGTGGRRAPIGLERAAGDKSRFTRPRLELAPKGPVLAVESMTITEFRTYLACPMRYALERGLKLETLDDTARELDALTFGTLAHEVLCAFGSDGDARCLTRAEQIEAFLLQALDAEAERRFGPSPMPAVRVQLARMRQRLRGFATLQADMCRKGWRIRHCELEFKKEIALDVPGEAPMPLRGRIDRIDQNEASGAWRIIDYKTSEGGASPHQTHHKRKTLPDHGRLEWVDLQLPLYHYLATRCGLGIGEPPAIELGYICLPKRSGAASLELAEWSAAHLEQAWERARQVVRDIRAGKFEINLDFDGGAFDQFARICQTTVYRDALAEAEAELEDDVAADLEEVGP